MLPEMQVGQDIYHYSIRYVLALNGTSFMKSMSDQTFRYTRTIKTSHSDCSSAIGCDIASALLSETAAMSAMGRARYCLKEEQTKLMEECFRKWQDQGVFTTAVESVCIQPLGGFWSEIVDFFSD